MKKIKLITILLIIFLVTGCVGDYNISINGDLSINEELNLELENTGVEYSKTLKLFNDNKISKDNYNVSINDSNVIIKYTEHFDSIDDYILNSKIYHILIDEIKYSRTDDYIDIYINQNLKLNNDKNNVGNLSDIDFLQINIKNPYKVIVNNADSLGDDIYTWNINKDTINKKILMQFEPKSAKIPYRAIIPAIVLVICISILAYIIIRNYKKVNKI